MRKFLYSTSDGEHVYKVTCCDDAISMFRRYEQIQNAINVLFVARPSEIRLEPVRPKLKYCPYCGTPFDT